MCNFKVKQCNGPLADSISNAIRENNVQYAYEIALQAIRNQIITVICSSHGTIVSSDLGYFLCESAYCGHNGGPQKRVEFHDVASRYVNALVRRIKEL